VFCFLIFCFGCAPCHRLCCCLEPCTIPHLGLLLFIFVLHHSSPCIVIAYCAVSFFALHCCCFWWCIIPCLALLLFILVHCSHLVLSLFDVVFFLVLLLFVVIPHLVLLLTMFHLPHLVLLLLVVVCHPHHVLLLFTVICCSLLGIVASSLHTFSKYSPHLSLYCCYLLWFVAPCLLLLVY
jgi:hypothetical protein